MRSVTLVSLLLWAGVILVPLAVLFSEALFGVDDSKVTGAFGEPLFRTFALSSLIGAAAVVLGYVPGRLLGTCRKGRDVLLFVLLMPLVLPRYVLYYAWFLLRSPTTELGRYLAAKPAVAQFADSFIPSAVLTLWFWPLAALLLAQGWREIDSRIWDSARLEADNFQIFKNITGPLLLRPAILAFGVCFVLSVSDFATFHLAGVRTIGTELAVLYESTGSHSAVARAAWPLTIPAAICAVALTRKTRFWQSPRRALGTVEFKSQSWRWAVLLVLLSVSLLIPLALLITNVSGTEAFRQFLTLHMDELGWSLAVAALAAGGAYLIAFGATNLEQLGRGALALRLAVRSTIFLAMFIPASLIAVSIIRIMAACNFPTAVRQSCCVVSAGQAARFTGVALILLLLSKASQQKHLSEMASLDGASRLGAWWHVHLPGTWRLFLGVFLLIVMFGMTELSATMVLLPAGVPNFAQRLLNQMHYARDQQVIASCLLLIFVFVSIAAVLALLLRAVRLNRYAAVLLVCASALVFSGCDEKGDFAGEPKILNAFGQTGRGQGQFTYPRAVDIAPDGSVFVVDKTGRIQSFTPEGVFLAEFRMPLVEAGKPTGMSFGPDGNLYVADTHYHRVVVFSPNGEVVDEFGKFGEDDGCFIYPTDVAFAGDGRIFVSEYGGNDRVSVFSEKGVFRYSFGSPGSKAGELSRPSALCADQSRRRLYVADACNHRIAVYDFQGRVLEYIGSVGRGGGQLRYPYDLALLSNGDIAVCEYGNNRLQLFGPDGQSLGVYGRAGRALGELAYPWGLAVDGKTRSFIVDAGNNRIQLWQL